MSRIGRKPIIVPSGVKVNINGTSISVSGPKGNLNREIHFDMKVKMENSQIIVERPSDNKLHRSLHGLTRTLISNMVEGVTTGFTKTLRIEGIGYRAEVANNKLNMQLGFTHVVSIEVPTGLSVNIEKQTIIKIGGADKELVGYFAAKVRAVKKPEPYKGKGIRYIDEYVKKKVGKAATTTGGGKA